MPRDTRKLSPSKMTIEELENELQDINKKPINQVARDRGYKNIRRGGNSIIKRGKEVREILKENIPRERYERLMRKLSMGALKSLPVIGLGAAMYSDEAGAVERELIDTVDPTGFLSPTEMGSGELSREEMIKRKRYNDLIKKNLNRE